MTSRAALRIALRELRGGLVGFRIFLLCLTLGVAAIAAVGSVGSSIEAGLAREGARLLGGDAELRFTYRYATEDERAWMEGVGTDVSEIVDFRSMAVVGEERGLTQVKGVDAAYPLKGAVVLDPVMPLADALAGRDGLPGAVMHQVLVDRLGLAPGDTFRLGTQDFVLTAILEVEPDDGASGFSLGPRTIVLRDDLARSGLIGPGTLFESNYRIALPQGSDLSVMKSEAEERFRDQGARWRDARNGAPGTRAFVERLETFLILVGLAGLAVGGVGVSAAVRAYLATKTEVIATLKTLGADRRVIFLIYAIEIGALTALGLILGVALGAALPLALAPVIAGALPLPAAFALYPAPLVEAALYGLLVAALFTLWPLARAADIRPAALFRDAIGRRRLLPGAGYLAATLVLFAALVGVAALLSDIPRLTLWTAAAVIGALVLLTLTSAGDAPAGTAAVRRALAKGTGALAAGFGRGQRLAPGSGSCGFVPRAGADDLGGGRADRREPARRDRAGFAGCRAELFFVDIQSDQMEGFRARLDGDEGVSRVQSAPMLRGIITRINGRPAREVAGDHWVIRGDRGVTYAAEPGPETKVTAGAWWPKEYNGPPQVSFAAEEAAEMGLKLGDAITVNILGRDIEAEITSFREVDFSTAGIGFIMSMNPGALAGAPHSHIATVYASAEAEAPILRDLATAYPNITAIRVRDAIDRVAGILGGLASAISYGRRRRF